MKVNLIGAVLVSASVLSSFSNAYGELDGLQKIRQLREHSEIYVEIDPTSLFKAELEKALPSKSKIVPYYKTTLLIRLDSPAKGDLVQKIKKVRGVKFADFNHIYSLKQSTTAQSPASEPCIPDNGSSAMQDLPVQVVQITGKMAKKRPCGTQNVCNWMSPGDKLWAQNKVDENAMLDLMKEWGLLKSQDSEKVKVAILDTGLDQKGLSDRGLIPDGAKVSFEPGFPEAGDPKRDETGHGTPIFSLFMGKGIGLAPNSDLTVMRIVEKGNHPNTSDAAIKTAVAKACDSGNKIIVLSWGSLEEETGQVSFFSDNLKQSLLEKGCTVVRAAGNDAKRDSARKSTSLDESDLTVASIDNTGSFSNFSSGGLVSAPGTRIYAYPSTDPEHSSMSGIFNTCADAPGEMTSGTSFAGPVAAAILTQVETVLSSNKEFNNLSGPQKVALRNRILKASEFGGSVNGVRAILIAKNWSLQTDNSLTGLKMIVNQPYSHPQCQAKREDCTDASCNKLKACLANNGLRLKVCSATLDRAQLATYLNELVDSSDPSAVLDWFPAIKENKTLSLQEKNAFLEKLWRSQGKTQFGIPSQLFDTKGNEKNLGQAMPDEFPLRVAPELIRSYENDPDRAQKVARVAAIALASNGIGNQIYKTAAQSWTTEDKADEVRDFFKAVDSSGPSSFEQVVNDWIKTESKYRFLGIGIGKTPLENEKIGQIVWSLNALRSDPYFNKHQTFINNKINSILKDLSKRNVFTSDGVYSVIEPTLERNKAEIVQRAKDALKSDSLSDLGSLDMRYLVDHSEVLGNQKSLFLAKVLQKMNENDGWDKANGDISIHAVGNLILQSDKSEVHSDFAVQAVKELPGKAQDHAVLATTFMAFAKYRDVFNGAKPEDLKSAKDELKALSVILDDDQYSLLSKRLAVAQLAEPGFDLSGANSTLIRNLVTLPDRTNLNDVAPVRVKSRRPSDDSDGPSTARTNQDLADELVARLFSEAWKFDKLTAEGMKESNTNKMLQGSFGGMGPKTELLNIYNVLPKNVDADRKNWKRLAAEVKKYRQYIKENGVAKGNESFAQFVDMISQPAK